VKIATAREQALCGATRASAAAERRTFDPRRSCVVRVSAELADELRLAERSCLWNGCRKRAERSLHGLGAAVELGAVGEEAVAVVLHLGQLLPLALLQKEGLLVLGHGSVGVHLAQDLLHIAFSREGSFGRKIPGGHVLEPVEPGDRAVRGGRTGRIAPHRHAPHGGGREAVAERGDEGSQRREASSPHCSGTLASRPH
jgi:hypothetical protein